MSNSYSSLQKDNNKNQNVRWHNIPITEYTFKKRQTIKPLLDDFTSFNWRGVDAWENFGAFILNERNSLKFSEGATWTNQYSQPQFSSQNGLLTGMSFKTPQISFVIGVYWFSEEDYRFLLDWLSPYEVNALYFSFSPDYYYQAKLSAISQGTRYVLGQEEELKDSNNKVLISKYRYYTEIKLSFELQGPSCAYYKDITTWKPKTSETEVTTLETSEAGVTTLETTDKMFSDIGFPIEANIELYPTTPESSNQKYTTVTLSVEYQERESELFSCVFQNLPYPEENETNENLALEIRYTSEDGLLFWRMGDSKFKLLTALSTLSTGSRLVRSFSSEMFQIPGRFEIVDCNPSDFKFKIQVSSGLTLNTDITVIQGSPRTNVI